MALGMIPNLGATGLGGLSSGGGAFGGGLQGANPMQQIMALLTSMLSSAGGQGGGCRGGCRCCGGQGQFGAGMGPLGGGLNGVLGPQI